ncbi:MAG: transcription antitermination factor NusB [Flavobacteriales bacterium]
MLSRRHIRSKVLQSLYGYFQSKGSDPASYQKALFKSMERVRELYLLLLLMLVEFHHQAEHLIEERKKKRLPSAKDLNPDLRFIHNSLLHKLRDSETLNKEWEREGTASLLPRDLIPSLFKEFENSELYKDHMEKEELGHQEERDFLAEAFRQFIADSETFQLRLEERSIHWVDDLDLASSVVLRTLKEMPTRPEKRIELPPLYRDDEADPAFARKLFLRTIDQDRENRRWIQDHLRNWELDRIAFIDMLLLEMAIAEARSFEDIPVKVSINEYIELAKLFSTPKSNRFLNGILDKVIPKMREEGMVHKVGKGLIE